eukprot:m.482538 g.482538  ORF g.482538 m.482538 type:complete len:296 (+) comp22570_c0_seq1:73-960(+)
MVDAAKVAQLLELIDSEITKVQQARAQCAFSPVTATTAADALPGVLDAVQTDVPAVGNVYNINDSVYTLALEETGTAYGESAESTRTASTSFRVARPDNFDLAFDFDQTPVEVWGINFAATLWVRHKSSGSVRPVYWPGTRTYDPAGMTGDPHASERIGPSCAKAQGAISAAQVAAVRHGATAAQVQQIQAACEEIIRRYHGRVQLFEWMHHQIQMVVFEDREPESYPQFLQGLVHANKLDLTADNREHTRKYLETFVQGAPRPPTEFFCKVKAKDDVATLFHGPELQRFEALCV